MLYLLKGSPWQVAAKRGELQLLSTPHHWPLHIRAPFVVVVFILSGTCQEAHLLASSLTFFLSASSSNISVACTCKAVLFLGSFVAITSDEVTKGWLQRSDVAVVY